MKEDKNILILSLLWLMLIIMFIAMIVMIIFYNVGAATYNPDGCLIYCDTFLQKPGETAPKDVKWQDVMNWAKYDGYVGEISKADASIQSSYLLLLSGLIGICGIVRKKQNIHNK